MFCAVLFNALMFLTLLCLPGYKGIYHKRARSNVSDGCAIFYKTDIFLLKSSELVSYYEKVDKAELKKDNVGIIAILQPCLKKLKNKSPICIVNTQLVEDEFSVQARLMQAAILLAELDRSARYENYPAVHRSGRKSGYIPIVLCGELNVIPFSDFYDFYVKGKFNYNDWRTACKGEKQLTYGLDGMLPKSLGVNCKWKSVKPSGVENIEQRLCEPEINSVHEVICLDSGNEMSDTVPVSNTADFSIQREQLIEIDLDQHKQSPEKSVGSKSHTGSENNVESLTRKKWNEKTSAVKVSKQNTDKLTRIEKISDKEFVTLDLDSDDEIGIITRNFRFGQSSCEDDKELLRHDFNFSTAYMHCNTNGEGEVTICHETKTQNTDYIFYTPTNLSDSKEEHLWVSGVLELLTKKTLKEMDKLPNEYISSDHLLLLVSFILR